MSLSLRNKFGIDAAMVLSAGFGTRLKPITDKTPKALVEVNGRPMLGRILDQLRESGVGDVVVNTHYLANQVHEFVSHYNDNYPVMNIMISHEPEILDTGGGIKRAADLYDLNTMLMMNCDGYFVENPIDNILSKWDPNKMDALLALQPRVGQKGDFNIAIDGSLLREEDNVYTFSGLRVMDVSDLRAKKEDKFSFTTDYLFPILPNPKVLGYEDAVSWVDIGSLDSLRYAASLDV